ncbi:type I methionyl aminopeptidase [Paenibacillus silviterrae]|uniref:type I methionyl aminopeptidase n=1 Tax=Paenibacillus silviterrae TaxID=3242194 RepID=UPI002543D2FC|nr:type I methionyl aminopeptidase [Paenibacillus chinjuensis]
MKRPKGYIKRPEEIQKIQKAGAILSAFHSHIAAWMKPGVSTMEINEEAERFLEKYGAKPATKGYQGFPYATCISINDEAAHGFPREAPLQSGDIVKLDIVCSFQGWLADSARTYLIGEATPEAKKLVRTAKECLELGLRRAIAGNRIGDVMYPLQKHVEQAGYSIVQELRGHGIGRAIHEQPLFTHTGRPGTGFLLQEGMVLTIEPIVNEGGPDVYLEADGWTLRTWDGSLSAQFEHTIVITKKEPIIVTR